MAHHLADDGILSFSLNPGGIKTNLVRHTNAFATWLLSFIFHEPWKGAVTPLFAGTSTTLTKKDSGKYFIPWAREAAPHAGIQDPALADKLWDFLEEDTAGKY
jgi:NAD(P)-dependent dehydrogenase (short-subunit alcohol dehydrogenase family)